MHRLVAAVLAFALAATAAQAATVKLTAKNVWKRTPIVVHAGDVITISATGHWAWSDGAKVDPNGDPTDDYNAFDLFEPFDFFSQARLLAYIGDYPKQKRWGDGSFFPQTSGYISVGAGQTFVAPYGGKLWLGFNDGAVTESTSDNSGVVTANITVKAPGTAGPGVSIAAPAGVYVANQSVTASYACNSSGSIASCTGPVANGATLDTSLPGHYAFHVTAVDDQGNSTTRTSTYVVTDASSSAVWPTGGAFDPTYLGTMSAVKPFYLTNPQSTTLNIAGINIGNDFNNEFHISGTTCGATLAAHHTCKISVTYQPAVVGTARAELDVSADFPAAAVPLWGNGTQVRATPAALAFAGQSVGTTSAPLIARLTNGQATFLAIKEIAASGDFAIDPSSTCPASGGKLAMGKTCNIVVTFTPTATGARSGSLTVHGATQIDPVSVTLSGTGL